MNDIYIEQLIKRKTPMKENMIKILLILVTVLVFFFSLMNPLLMLVAIILIVVDVFLFRNMDIEYEYLYINGTLDIDKIMAKSRRKSIFEMDVNDLEIMAPSGAPELRQYQGLKAVNYSSGMPGRQIYEMILSSNGTKKRILIEPQKELVESMWLKAPRKVLK